jgi:hypothetical protein
MRLIAIAFIALTCSIIPIASFAQSSSSPSDFACRSVKSGDTPNATIQNKPAICHSPNMAKIHNAMMALMNDNLTADQKAKLTQMMGYVEEEMLFEGHYPGYNGNPNNP